MFCKLGGSLESTNYTPTAYITDNMTFVFRLIQSCAVKGFDPLIVNYHKHYYPDSVFHSVFLLFFLQKVSCADSNVGDAKVRGISGGEKKRLSLACELIASPSVIFADEPTTGMHD